MDSQKITEKIKQISNLKMDADCFFKKGALTHHFFKVDVPCENKRTRAHLHTIFKLVCFVQKFCVITLCSTDFFVWKLLRNLRIRFAHAENKKQNLEGKQRVCATNPQNLLRDFGRQATGLSDKPQNFVLSCLLGRKFSFDLFCRFARFVVGNKKSNRN